MTMVVHRSEPHDVYIGRPSKWGNPFIIGVDGDRNQVIKKYYEWLMLNNDLMSSLHELKGKTLGCWCKPAPCHGDILANILESRIWIKNWFSNMLPNDTAFVYQGIKYTCVENFYQAMKTKDLSQRKKIAAMTAFQAKKFARRSIQLRPDWNNIRVDVMRYALRTKFVVGTTWHQKLVETGNNRIVEWNNWGDTFWGVDVRKNIGVNTLGNLLIKLRNTL